jgi:hypothetical protein
MRTRTVSGLSFAARSAEFGSLLILMHHCGWRWRGGESFLAFTFGYLIAKLGQFIFGFSQFGLGLGKLTANSGQLILKLLDYLVSCAQGLTFGRIGLPRDQSCLSGSMALFKSDFNWISKSLIYLPSSAANSSAHLLICRLTVSGSSFIFFSIMALLLMIVLGVLLLSLLAHTLLGGGLAAIEALQKDTL